MTKQESRQIKKMQEKARRQKEREAWEAARGPMDLPFFLLAMLLLTIGLVLDIWTEKANDDVKYKKKATQEDFDLF